MQTASLDAADGGVGEPGALGKLGLREPGPLSILTYDGTEGRGGRRTGHGPDGRGHPTTKPCPVRRSCY